MKEFYDFVGIEDLKVTNMVKNRKLAKSISDASWSVFRNWLEYYGEISEVQVVAVSPAYTSQMCSSCGVIVKKGLECRVHECPCGCVLDRDENAAKNILAKAYEAVGHTDSKNASGEKSSTSGSPDASRLVEGRICGTLVPAECQ